MLWSFGFTEVNRYCTICNDGIQSSNFPQCTIITFGNLQKCAKPQTWYEVCLITMMPNPYLLRQPPNIFQANIPCTEALVTLIPNGQLCHLYAQHQTLAIFLKRTYRWDVLKASLKIYNILTGNPQLIISPRGKEASESALRISAAHQQPCINGRSSSWSLICIHH